MEHLVYYHASNELVDFCVIAVDNGIQCCEVSRYGGPFQLDGILELSHHILFRALEV